MFAQRIKKDRNCSPVNFVLASLGLGLVYGLSSGCVSMAANMLYAIRGNELPAEYDGLTEKRVAVICSTDGASAGDAASTLLTSYICTILTEKLPKAHLVPPDEVEQRMEIEGWSKTDIGSIGKGLNADQVVIVKISDLKLRDGATLFRGQCNIDVDVYDVKTESRLVFTKKMADHTFPQHGGVPVTDTTEANFRNAYLQLVASRVAALFHKVDPTQEYALDATAGRI